MRDKSRTFSAGKDSAPEPVMSYHNGLSGALAGQYLGEAYGSVALLTDLMRELIGPTVVFMLGRNFANSSIGVCGATAMDTTLPFVRQACHYEYVPTAIISGLILTIAAPFFMLFFLSFV